MVAVLVIKHRTAQGQTQATPSVPGVGRACQRLYGDRTRRLAVVALAGTLAYLAIAGWRHAAPPGGGPAEPAFRWVPFQAQFGAPFPVMLGDVLEETARYAFLTLLCLFLTQGRGRAVSLLLLLGVVGSLEVFRALVLGRGADTTAPLLALLAWLLTTCVWKAICPRQTGPTTRPALSDDGVAPPPEAAGAMNAASTSAQAP